MCAILYNTAVIPYIINSQNTTMFLILCTKILNYFLTLQQNDQHRNRQLYALSDMYTELRQILKLD